MHTSQLHKIPRVKATEKGAEHFMVAMLTAPGRSPSVPALNAKKASSKEPTKFPRYDAIQLFARSFDVAFPSWTAAVTSAVFPVKSSAPVTRVMMRPNGRPNAPRMIYIAMSLQMKTYRKGEMLLDLKIKFDNFSNFRDWKYSHHNHVFFKQQ